MELEADPPTTGTGAQPSGPGTGEDGEADAVLQAMFVYEDVSGNGEGTGEEFSVAASQSSVHESNILGRDVSRELFPSGLSTPDRIQPPATATVETVVASGSGRGTARQSQTVPVFGEQVQTPSASGRRNQRTQSLIPSALDSASEASARYFRNLTRNNRVLSMARFQAYQSHLSVNRKREEVLDLQRLEILERLKQLNPNIVLPPPQKPLFSYTNSCMADPSELLFLSDEEEEQEGIEEHREGSILLFYIFLILNFP